MSKSKSIIWVVFAVLMFVQVGVSYLVYKNQNDLSFLMNMKSYIPFMLYFSIILLIVFMFSFMFSQLEIMKASKQIGALENDKNQLKAKLFDFQEASQNKEKETKALPLVEAKQEEPPKNEDPAD